MAGHGKRADIEYRKAGQDARQGGVNIADNPNPDDVQNVYPYASISSAVMQQFNDAS